MTSIWHTVRIFHVNREECVNRGKRIVDFELG